MNQQNFYEIIYGKITCNRHLFVIMHVQMIKCIMPEKAAKVKVFSSVLLGVHFDCRFKIRHKK